MPSIIPPSPIDVSASTSPRPASPVEEAQEAFSPNEDDDDDMKKMAQSRRKSSIWKKALNIKKRISKVNMSFGDGVQPRFGPTDGTPLSPIEVSPTTVEAPSTEDLTQRERAEMEAIERSIVQNLAALNANSDYEERSDDDNAGDNSDSNMVVERRQSMDPDAEWKKRVMTQPQSLQTRRSDASEELAMRVSTGSYVEGSRQSRPSELSLFDECGRPIPPPRAHANRNQRLLSVPNIKYNRSISENTRIKTRKEPISIAANLMRRFSKYLLREWEYKNNLLKFNSRHLILKFMYPIWFFGFGLIFKTTITTAKKTSLLLLTFQFFFGHII